MAEDPPRHPFGDPRVGEDRRQEERRKAQLTAEEEQDWLRLAGITERRKAQRRGSKPDRRRR